MPTNIRDVTFPLFRCFTDPDEPDGYIIGTDNSGRVLTFDDRKAVILASMEGVPSYGPRETMRDAFLLPVFLKTAKLKRDAVVLVTDAAILHTAKSLFSSAGYDVAVLTVDGRGEVPGPIRLFQPYNIPRVTFLFVESLAPDTPDTAVCASVLDAAAKAVLNDLSQACRSRCAASVILTDAEAFLPRPLPRTSAFSQVLYDPRIQTIAVSDCSYQHRDPDKLSYLETVLARDADTYPVLCLRFHGMSHFNRLWDGVSGFLRLTRDRIPSGVFVLAEEFGLANNFTDFSGPPRYKDIPFHVPLKYIVPAESWRKGLFDNA